MKVRVLALASLALTACNPNSDQITLGAPAQKALKTSELNADGRQRLKTLSTQVDLNQNALFSQYRTSDGAKWNSGWTRRIDFSGVSWNHRQAGTAVTPRHIVLAAHYQLKVGTSVIFHERSGKAHRRKIKRVISLNKKEGLRTDIAVALLDTPLPPTIKTYRLLPPREDYSHALIGSPTLITEQKRRVFLHKIRGINNNYISFQKDDSFSENLYKSLIKGDSGNPSFLLVGGEPVLIETHTGGGGGSGPFYSSPSIFKLLEETVAELDPAYRLQTVPLDPELAPAPPKPEPKSNAKPAIRVRRVPSPPNTPPNPRVRRVPPPATEAPL